MTEQTFLFGLTTGVALCATVQWLATLLKPAEKRPFLFPLEPPSPSHSRKRSDTLSEIPPMNPAAILPTLADKLTVSQTTLQNMVLHMMSEFRKGLMKDGEKLKMLPSYVVSKPSGSETGTVIALDFGGSNFRVCKVDLEGQGHIRLKQSKHPISDELKKASGKELFDFFADCVASFLKECELEDQELVVGFTFSFPLRQHALDHGTLLLWNKSYCNSGVIGKDVVNLLDKAFHRKGLKLKINAVINDTVGTLISHAYKDPQTAVAIILGTGTNAAYFEKLEEIPKLQGKGEMVINTEWGAYDEPTVLPITVYDQALDRATINPKSQIYEKMISGMYLGELVRLILLDLIRSGEIFSGNSSLRLDEPYHFDTAFMSRIERDHSLDLTDTKAVLEDVMGLKGTTLEDRRIVRHVCELVGTRAARLAAAGVAAVVTKINKLDGCTIAVDGSLFEHYPHFANRMRDALREILGMSAANILLEQARDGSGQGAAVIAAVHK